MATINIPNRPYWAVFQIADEGRAFKQPIAVSLFILKMDAEHWVKDQGYTKDEVIIKRVYSQINVIV